MLELEIAGVMSLFMPVFCASLHLERLALCSLHCHDITFWIRRAGSMFVTYMIVGLAYGTNKGEKGLNRLPNSDFWMELPLLVKVNITTISIIMGQILLYQAQRLL